ncbi:MAG: ParB N-terminal domain-containing protein [Chloroflexales bacterium]
MFHPDYPVTNLHPAPYNPRHLEDDAFVALQRSILKLGMVKPIIVADNGTIVAGHQRTRALLATGKDTTPAYVISGLNKMDEMKFNQLHNGTDLDTGDEHVTVPPSAVTGYVDVPCADVEGNLRAAGGPLRYTICGLLTIYGPWGGIVATKSGKCISGAQYALSCKLVNIPVRVYYVEDKDATLVKAIFQKQYGTFCYDGLPKTTYAQTFAQMYRVRKDKHGVPRGVKAPNYEKIYIPGFVAGERILDFGCGQGDYVRLLQEKGVRIWGVEFFYRIGSHLNTEATHKMIDSLIATLDREGRFDKVICEFVLNSTDSLHAEASVMTCLNALCRPGGQIFASGRTLESIEGTLNVTGATQENLTFLDDNGYTARILKGQWFYQKYHSTKMRLDLAHTYIGPEAGTGNAPRAKGTFLISGQKHQELPLEQVKAALAFEFNLMWPNQQTVNRHREIIAAYERAIAREAAAAQG